jgi:hypothetical protein
MRHLFLLLSIISVSCFGQSKNNSLVGKWVGYYDYDTTHSAHAHTPVYRSAIILVFKKDHHGSLYETNKNGKSMLAPLTFIYKISNQNRVSWTYTHTCYKEKAVSEFSIKGGVLSLTPYPPKLRESIETFYLATYKKQ